MTDEQLDALEAAAKVATPGPWREAPLYDRIDSPMQVIGEHNRIVADCGHSIDSQFITAANPAVVLDLIAELRKARAELNWLAEKLARIARIYHMSMGLKNHEYWLDAARVGVEEQGGTPHVSESD